MRPPCAADRRDSQSAQAVQKQAINAAGAGSGELMRGFGPGSDGPPRLNCSTAESTEGELSSRVTRQLG